MLFCALTLVLTASERPQNADVFLESSLVRDVRDNADPQAAGLLKSVYVSSTERRWGVPTVLWAPTPPPGAPTFRTMGLTPEQAARRYLVALAPVYRLRPAEMSELQLADAQELPAGATLVSFTRVVSGLPVYRHRLTVVMNHELELVGITGALPPTRGTPQFRLTPETAVATALQELTGVFPTAAAVRRVAFGAGGWAYHDVAGGLLAEPPRVRRVVYSTDTRLVAAYQVELVVPRANDERWAYTMVVSAEDGRRLTRLDATADAAATYRVWAQSTAPFAPLPGPQANAVSPYPQSSPTPYPSLAFLAPLLVTVDSISSSTQDPWLPAGSTALTGNNAVAYVDLYPPDGFNDPDAGLPRLPDGGIPDGGVDSTGRPYRSYADVRPSASGANTWDFTYDVTQSPTAQPAQLSGAAVQAFFIANWMHDAFYDRGFTERGGNAQTDNFGRGGVAGDALQVEVDDWNQRNGAAMSAFADGQPPKLELGVFDFNARSTLGVNTPDAAVYPATPVVAHDRAFDVTADALFVQTLDGGVSICGPYVNAAALAGKVAIGQAGPCLQDAILALAADAGASGVLLTGVIPPSAAIDIADSTAVPMQLISAAAAQQLFDAADAGQAINVTLHRDVAPDLPAALDATVVMHEWTHLLTSRLVGDGNGLLPTQARGLGEGWSDFVALVWASNAADAQVPSNANWNGSYAIGAYALSGTDFAGDPSPSSYFGIRRYPYSTDLAKDPLTLKHSGTNVPLPASVARSPRPVAADNAEPHNAGEVWATALWEVYTAFLRDPRYTFDQARPRVLDYLVAALKTTPVLPTFTEARDAMLLVMRASNVQDFTLAQGAFARRGLGLLARSADRYSSTNTPLAEDFSTTGAAYALVDATLADDVDPCDSDGFLDNNEAGTLTITLMNIGVVRLVATTLTLRSSNPNLVFTSLLNVAPSDPFTTVTVKVPISAGQVATVSQATTTFTVVLDDTALPAQASFSKAVRLNADRVMSSTEGFELGAPGWSTAMNGDFPYEDSWRIKEVSPASHTMHSKDPGAAGETLLTSPPLHVGAGPLSFTFVHTYNFEASATQYFDGALLEISTDGQTFTQIPGSAISPTYPGTLVSTGLNPLAGKPAFVGQQLSSQTETVALGTQYANQTVWIRFHVGADVNGSSTGWTVDDVTFTGLTDQPFQDVVAHRGICANHAPTITSGAPDLTVDERSHVVLVAAKAADRDMDPLTFSWNQTVGPPVTLTGSEFDAPDVTSRTDLGFHLTVSDGRGGMVGDDVVVTVRNVNRAPTANAGQPLIVVSGDTVTLDGSASSDPDQDHLLFTWRRTSGPVVHLEGANTATASFIAPDVTTPTDFTFELVVDDSEVKSDPAVAAVTVNPKPKGCGCTVGDPSWALGLLALGLSARRRRARSGAR